LYWVEVEKVNMIKSPYKKRQRRWLVRKAYVKAVVTLKEGQKVPQLDKVK
jgi:ribosomal protein L23